MSAGAEPPVRVVVRVVDDARRTTAELHALLRREGDAGGFALLPLADNPLPAFAPGDVLVLGKAKFGDAMYVRPVRVVADLDDEPGYLVSNVGDERREQQRDHVRVTTPPVQTVITPLDAQGQPAHLDDDGDPVTIDGLVVDFSAGGVRVALDEPPFLRGSLANIRFTLPADDKELEIDMRAEVRWVRAGDEHCYSGLMFLDVRPLLEQRMTSWVFQQQAKQLRVRRG